jgi:hypothetical protein
VDEFTQELELMEAIVSAADATLNARVHLEGRGGRGADRGGAVGGHPPPRVPLLEAEARRLDADYRRLRYGG